MVIKTLHAKNFRLLEDTTVTFHPKFTLIAGANGKGKTTLLEALRIMLGALFLKFDKEKDKLASPSMLRDDVRLSNMEPQYPVELTATAEIPEVPAHKSKSKSKSEIKWTRTLETKGGRTTSKEAKEMQQVSEDLQAAVRRGHETTVIPLVAYFSTDRFKKEKRDVGVEAAGSRLRGYYNALDAWTNTNFFLNTWYTETLSALQNGELSTEMLQAVETAIKNTVTNCSRVYFDIRYKELLIVRESDGNKIPFHMLSDGLRCTLAMVMEIAMRCALLNPALGKDAPLKTPGVVVIDEIDLHLHPEWQLRIIDDLCRAFPQMQFIATTHAPIVIGSLHNGKILSIDRGEVHEFPLQYGRDANYILREMNSSEMQKAIKDKIQKYHSLIEQSQGRSPEALELRTALEEILGAGHPEIQQADLLLSLY